jgi:Sulfotransferase family
VAEGLKVFVLGPARSGTSITYFALQGILGLPGDGESHVLPAFQRVVFTFARYCEQFGKSDGVLARRLNPSQFRAHVIAYLRDFYDQIYVDGSFVDKTPGAEAIAGVPLIQEAFPEARIIVTKRTGIEVVQSHVRKFEVSFADACHAWSASMEALRRVRLSSGNILEIDQHELAIAPRVISIQIAAYLQCPEKTGDLTAFFGANLTDRYSDHDWSERLIISDMSWTDEEKQTFTDICGGQMKEFGYPM